MTVYRPQDQRSERRIRNNQIRRRREMRRHFLLFMMTLCLIITCSITVSSFRSNAKNEAAEKDHYKYYKSIIVSDSDTLWSIAEEYMDETHYDSIHDYIREVMQINTLTDDAIYADAHLIVPYYGEAK